MNLSSLYGLELTREVKEVLDVIAQNITTNVRDLNGAFTRVTARSRLLDLPLDKELAKKVLADHSIDV
jgi:chromosomal replication initiator protein